MAVMTFTDWPKPIRCRVFDGQGHTISGLTVYVVDHSNAGLFSALGNGQIKS